MMKFLLIYFYVFILILNAQTLSVEEAIDEALKNHPDIKKLSLGVQLSGSLVDVAKADYLPQLNVGAQYNPHNTFIMPQNGQFKTITDDNWQLEAQLNQKIYDFSKTTSIIKAYEKNKDIASLSLKDAKALLIHNVKNIYDAALFQTKALEVRKKDLRTKEELYKQAQALVREGLKTEADATTILSAVYNAEDALGTTKADLKKALSALSFYMGKKVDLETDLIDNLPSLAGQNKESIIGESYVNNFALKGLKEEIVKEGLMYKAAKAKNYGSIDAVASYTHQNSINEYDTSMIGIGITIPLYSGGRISAQTEETRISQEMAKESYNAKKLLLQEEIDTLMIDLERYEHTIKAKEALIDSSRATKEIVEARYKEGLSTYIEILDAASTSLYAELDLLEAKFSIKRVMNRLEYLRGERV
ncbi:TolC family protein [Sulfurimonas sp.]|uniref:TolC family protein n=1 Tax=Sulfurimonas sp. TaxID=2022749 RepID=UPI0025E015ED|nr:TolC family protein [Sulfurimonas sp.]MBW6489354.1 TolC family protein [Sulfurimonas sp.]